MKGYTKGAHPGSLVMGYFALGYAVGILVANVIWLTVGGYWGRRFTKRKEGMNATQEGEVPEGDQSEHQDGDGARQAPETGGGDRHEQGGQVQEEGCQEGQGQGEQKPVNWVDEYERLVKGGE